LKFEDSLDFGKFVPTLTTVPHHLITHPLQPYFGPSLTYFLYLFLAQNFESCTNKQVMIHWDSMVTTEIIATALEECPTEWP
jgi:hypothetical protein